MSPNTPPAPSDDGSADLSPLGAAEALARTAQEACRQHERLGRLVEVGAHPEELAAAHAMVDTIDLALAEAVRTFESSCRTGGTISDPEVEEPARIHREPPHIVIRPRLAEAQQLAPRSAELGEERVIDGVFIDDILVMLRRAAEFG